MKIKAAAACVSLLILIVFSFQWMAPHTHSEGTVTLYSNQLHQDLTHQYVEAIRRAKKTVLLLIYSLNEPKIIKALNEKQKEGVAVSIITDAKTSLKIKQKLNDQISLTQRFFKGLMHLKILVLDDQEVWLGSANMTPDSLKRQGNLVMTTVHPGLAHMVSSKAKTLGPGIRHGTTVPTTFTVTDQQLELWFFPDSHGGVDKLKKLIRSAQKTIRVAMYTWTRQDLAHEMMFAKQRGVDVQVALDRSSALGMSKKVAQYIKKSKIPLFHNMGKGLLHHKFMVIDDQILVLGSANWTRAAFKTNDDCFLIITPLTPEQSEMLKQIWTVVAN